MRSLIRLILLTGLVQVSFPHDGAAQRQSQFIDPATTDSAIVQWTEAHYVSLNPSTPARNQLFLFFPGTGGLPRNYQFLNEHAADLGFHAVTLRYPNDRAVNTLCALRLDLDCHSQVRLEIVDGTDRSDLVEVDRTNSIENRLIKLLQHLEVTAPGASWGQYRHADGTINWPQIVVSGHSQGGGHAGIIASEHEVARVVMFAAMDYHVLRQRPAAWIDADNPTPARVYYGFGHLQDEPVDVGNLLMVWETYGLDAFGPVVNIDTLTAPYSGSHRLLTDVEPAFPRLTLSPFHNSVAVDVNTPRLDDGTPALTPVWTYLLTDETTNVSVDDIPHPDGFRLDQSYPNPVDATTTITFSVSQPGPASLRVYDPLGRLVATLVSSPLPAGHHTARWTADGLPNGVYFYTLRAGDRIAVKALTLLR